LSIDHCRHLLLLHFHFPTTTYKLNPTTAATPAKTIPTYPLSAETPFIAAPLVRAAPAEPDALAPPVTVVVGECDLVLPLEEALAPDEDDPDPADGPCKNEASAVAVEKMLM
jgi:hypothetical protein